MDSNEASHDDVVLDDDMSTERRAIRNDVVIPKNTIVGNMTIHHE